MTEYVECLVTNEIVLVILSNDVQLTHCVYTLTRIKGMLMNTSSSGMHIRTNLGFLLRMSL